MAGMTVNTIIVSQRYSICLFPSCNGQSSSPRTSGGITSNAAFSLSTICSAPTCCKHEPGPSNREGGSLHGDMPHTDGTWRFLRLHVRARPRWEKEDLDGALWDTS